MGIDPGNASIDHNPNGSKGAFVYSLDGKRLGEMTYSRLNDRSVIIDHTQVDSEATGQGVGRQLLDFAVEWARANGTKLIPICPFAAAQFRRDSTIRDVLG